VLVQFLNGDDPRVAAFPFAGKRVIYSLDHTPEGLELSLPGRHNVSNALAARVVADLGTVYGLAYRPVNKVRDGKWRAVRVNVDRPSAVARGKRGYFAN